MPTPVCQATWLALTLLAAPAGWALPQGATATLGQVVVAPGSSGTLEIVQGSARAGLDWRSFSIAAGERVLIRQPDAAAVLFNRVTGADPSLILGQLQSNGRVFLSNPRGIIFGAGSQVDVGSLVATTLNVNTTALANGHYALSGGAADSGELRADGRIHAPQGTVALVSPTLSVGGNIQAGRLGLAAAAAVQVDVDGDGLIFFNLRDEQLAARLRLLPAAELLGRSAELRAAARSGFADTVLNLEGVVRATGLAQRGGQVVIDGGTAGVTRVAGTVQAQGDGAAGGDLAVLGDRLLVTGGARLDASGSGIGGQLRLGGDFQGGNTALWHPASQVLVQSGATLVADAGALSTGGQIVVWSEQATRFGGTASARGGAAGGDGGLVEVSSRGWLDFAGTADLRATHGRAGTLLLDPLNIDIVAANPNLDGSVGGVADLGSQNLLLADYPGKTSTITAGRLATQIGLGSVVLEASNRISVAVNSAVSSPTTAVAPTSGDLTLRATNTIELNSPVAINGTGKGLTLQAPSITINDVDVSAASLTLAGAATWTVAGSRSVAAVVGGAGSLTKNGAGTLTLSAANTYTGGTTVSAGTLALSGAGRAGAAAGVITVSGGTLDVINNAVLANPISFSSGQLASSVGNGTLGGAITLSGDLVAGSGNASTLSLGGVIGEAALVTAGLSKTGAGTLALSGANTYSGATRVEAGVLAISQASALGGTAAGTTVLDGATLALSGDIAITEPLSLAGSGVAGAGGVGVGVLRSVSGNNRVGGAITLAAPARINTDAGTLTLDVAAGNAVTAANLGLSFGGAGNTTLADPISLGTGSLVKDGAGTLTLAAPNLFGGALTLSAGTLALGGSQALASVNGAGNIVLGAGTLTLGGGDADSSLDGVLSGIGGLAKNGSGTLTLSGHNTYGGATTVNAGVLRVTQGDALGDVAGATTVASGAALVLAPAVGDIVLAEPLNLAGSGVAGAPGGALRNTSGNNRLSGSITLSAATRINADAGSTLALEAALTATNLDLRVGGSGDTTVAAAIGLGSGGLSKDGSGRLSLSGNNSYSGSTTILAGVLRASHGNALGGAGAGVSVASDAALELAGDITLAQPLSLAGSGVAGGGALRSLGGNNRITGAVTLAAPARINTDAGTLTLDVAAGNAVTAANLGLSIGGGGDTVLADALSLGSGALAKDGVGTLNLVVGTAVGSTGSTAVGAGSLVLGATGDLGSGLITLSGGRLELQGAGTLANALRLDGGTLANSGAGATTLSGAVTLLSASTLDLGGPLTLSGALGGAGVLSKLGAPTLTLAGDLGGFSGGLVVQAGTLAIDSQGQARVLGAALSGAGDLLKLGAGTLTLTGANGNFSGSTTVQAGTLALDADTRLGAGGTLVLDGGTLQALGALTLNRGLTLGAGGGSVDSNGQAVALAGVVDGAGALRKTGAGTLALGGANTYAGGTTVSAGSLAIAAESRLGAGPLLLQGGALQALGDLSVNRDITLGAAGGTLDSNGHALALAGVLDGNGRLAKTGAGTLTLAGINTYTGGTTVSAGTLAITTEAQLGGGALTLDGGTLQALGALTFNGDLTLGAGGGTLRSSGPTVTLAGALVGNGVLGKAGAGTLVLDGNNAGFSGASRVSGGVLAIDSDARLGAGGGLTLDGGTLQALGALTLNRGLALGAAGGTVDSNFQAVTLAGALSGAGSLALAGAGTLALTGNNAGFSGATTVLAGTRLAIDRDARLGAGGTLTLDGGTLQALAGLTLNRGLRLLAGGGTLDTGAHALTVAGALSGSGDLGIQGAGTLTLAASGPTFSGNTRLDAGTLVLGAAHSAGSGTITLAGGQLDLQAAGVLDNSLVLAGGLLTASAGSSSVTGTISLQADSVIDVAGDALMLSGAIHEAGQRSLSKTGAGVLALRAASDHSGGTQVLAGTLAIDSGNRLGAAGSTLTLDGGTLRADADLTLGAQRTVVLGPGGGRIDSQNHSVDLRAEVIGNGGLGKLGSGALLLGGANTYSGDTLVSAGTLALANGQALADGSTLHLANAAGVTVQLQADETIAALAGGGAAGGQVQLGRFTLTSGALDSRFDGAVHGTGGLVKAGAGSFTLGGASDFTGGTRVSGGRLRLDGAVLAGSTVQLDDQPGVLLGLLGDSRIGALAGGGASGGAVDLDRFTLGAGGNGSDSLYAGVISGSGGLTKQGAGRLTLAAANQHSGSTRVSGGELLLADADALARSAVLLDDVALARLALAGDARIVALSGGGANGGRVLLDRFTLRVGGGGQDTLFAGAISGSGGLVKQGVGRLTLAGANTFTGGTQVEAGTLRLAGGQALADGAALVLADRAGAGVELLADERVGSLAGGGASGGDVVLGAFRLSVGGDGSSTGFGGRLSGSGGLSKQGAGVFTLSGINSYTGDTVVEAGTLALQGGQALPDSGRVTLWGAGAAVLQLQADETLGALADDGHPGAQVQLGSFRLRTGGNGQDSRFDGLFSGTGQLDKQGSGRFTLGGHSLHQGGTLVSAGTLATATDQALPDGGAVSVANAATLQLGGDQTLAALADLAGQAVDGSARVELGHHALTVRSAPGAPDDRYSGVLAAAAGGRLVKQGSGLLQLAGRAEGSLDLQIQQGTLRTLGPAALSADSTVSVAADGTLSLDDALTVRTLTLSGRLDGNGRLSVGGLTTLADATLTTALGTAALRSSGASRLAAPVQVAGSTEVADGRLQLDAGGSLQTAALVLQPGATLLTTTAGQLGAGAALQVAAGATLQLAGVEQAGTLQLAGTLQGGGQLDLSGRTTLDGGTVALALRTSGLDSDGRSAITAPVQAGSDSQLRSGVLTLAAGGQLDTPDLTLQAGQLLTTDAQALSAGTRVTVAAPATLQLGADTRVAGLQLAGRLDGPLAAAARLDVGGAFTLDGGTVAMPVAAASFSAQGNSQLLAAVQVGGTATLAAGRLDIGAGGRLGTPLLQLQSGSLLVTSAAQQLDPAGALQMAAGATLQLGGDQLLAGLADLAGLANAGPAQVQLGAHQLSVGADGLDSVFSGQLSGSGGLVKQGAGRLLLRADQGHGDTRIEAGTLQIGDGGRSGSLGRGAVLNDGTLRLALGEDRTLALAISGSGTLEQAGSATLTLAGAGLSYSGATLVSQGLLRTAAADVLPDASRVVVAAGARLVLGGRETVQALSADGAVVLGGSLQTSGEQRFGGPVTLGTAQPILLSALGQRIEALNDGNQWGNQPLSVLAGQLQLSAGRTGAGGAYRDLVLGELHLTGLAAGVPPPRVVPGLADADAGRSVIDAGRLQIGATVPAGQAANGVAAVDGLLQLDGGGLTLRAHATPVYARPVLAPGEGVPVDPLKGRALWLADDLISQGANSRVSTAVGSSLLLQATAGGSINLGQVRNRLDGEVSALSGADWHSAWAPVELPGGREVGQSRITLAGQALQIGGQGLEADLVRLSAGRLATDAGSVISARLWYNDAAFGVDQSTPGLQLTLLPEAYTTERSFGRGDQPISVNVGGRNIGGPRDGLSAGFVQVLPRQGLRGSTAVFLAGPRVGSDGYVFFHDGAGDPLELPVFYNGVLPATPQLAGSLSAVASVSETARRERFEEAVRTENVAIRLRAGVIAEVGPGRSATQGSQGMRLPSTCRADEGQLGCAAGSP